MIRALLIWLALLAPGIVPAGPPAAAQLAAGNQRFQTAAVDNFQRANAAFTTPWAVITGSSATFQVASDVANVSSLASASSYVNSTITWPANQFACAILGAPTTVAAGTGYGVVIRGAPGALTYYTGVASAAGFNMTERVGGGGTTTIATGTGTTWATGDLLCVSMSGTTIAIYKNWVQVTSVTDANIASGSAGIRYNQSDTSGSSVLEWFAGFYQ